MYLLDTSVYLMNRPVYLMDIRSVPIGHLMNTLVYFMDIRSVPIGHISLPNRYIYCAHIYTYHIYISVEFCSLKINTDLELRQIFVVSQISLSMINYS